MLNKKIKAIIGLTICISLLPTISVSAKDNRPSETSGIINVTDNSTVISKVLTFDEIVAEISNDNHITEKEAENQVISNFSKKLSPFNNSNYSLNNVQFSDVKTMATLSTYRTITQQFSARYDYKPYLKFYCETSESGSFRGIVTILNVGMDRFYNGISKNFGGTVYTNLEDPNRIYWIVNGDFYNNGTTTYNGGVEVKVGGSATVSFGASYSTSHFVYCYQDGRSLF